MEEIEEINLHIEDQSFPVKKSVLCEHSDYFRAMFSGNYIEQEQENINIDVVDAHSMNIILRYMDLGLIDLSEFTLPVIGNLALSVNFLQITELMKQIEYWLDLQLSHSNWMEIMSIGEQSCYSKLEHLAAAYGLLSFKSMKLENIPTMYKLFWYLSHPYLDTESELDVFKFGFRWITHIETGGDALLIILGSLDLKRVTSEELTEIITLIGDYTNSLAEKVLFCLQWLYYNDGISLENVTSKKTTILETFTERVYVETCNLIKESKVRKLEFTPAVPIWHIKSRKLEFDTNYLHTFSKEKGFERWLEVGEKNLWGWNVVCWGSNKVVTVCGEYGRGTGLFQKDVKIYDTFRKEWINHGVQLPARRHSGIAILGDSLFIIGGVGGFRVTLDSAMIYDLKDRTHRSIAKFPDPLQSPAVCTHKGSIYAGGFKNVYKYEDLGKHDRWKLVLTTEIRPNRLVSYRDYIYCMQNFFNCLHRFRPETDNKLELVTTFKYAPATVCNLRDTLLVFTRQMGGQAETMTVEEYTADTQVETKLPTVLYEDEDSDITINDVAGSCSLVLNLPSLQTEMSKYHLKEETVDYVCMENEPGTCPLKRKVNLLPHSETCLREIYAKECIVTFTLTLTITYKSETGPSLE